MIPLGLTSSHSVSLSLKPCFPSSLSPIPTRRYRLKILKQVILTIRKSGKCRAEFSSDAPVAAAIGACILNSLIFPLTPSPEDVEAESLIDSADARFAVMGIISFIPYFNWMSWVFAWMDTGKRRYAVYAIVYLAPYLRSNLSISPEDSWVPITSILLCILHIQIEASVKNGDLEGFQIFNKITKRLSSITQNKHESGLEQEGRTQKDLRDEIRGSDTPRKDYHDEFSNENEEGEY